MKDPNPQQKTHTHRVPSIDPVQDFVRNGRCSPSAANGSENRWPSRHAGGWNPDFANRTSTESASNLFGNYLHEYVRGRNRQDELTC